MGDFVHFRMAPTAQISSIPVMIWGDDRTCLIDSVRLRNETGTPLSLFLELKRYVIEPDVVKPVLKTFCLEGPVPLGGFESKVVVLDLNLEPQDMLFSYSDDTERVFSAFVSARVLMESVPS